jgi:hypothetical protein
MNRDELAYNAIKSAMDTLDCIDEMINSQSAALQEVDYKISDYLHYIENNDIEDKECVNLVKELKELRQIRRSLKKEYEIEKTYKENSGKVMGNNTRGMLLAEINKTIKQLDSEYKYRVINEEEIKDIIKCEKKKVGRPKKVKEEVEEDNEI